MMCKILFFHTTEPGSLVTTPVNDTHGWFITDIERKTFLCLGFSAVWNVYNDRAIC